MQLVLVVTVYIHPSPFGTDAAPLFHGKSAATFAPRTETRWGRRIGGGRSFSTRRSILLVRREPPPSLTFLSTLPSLAGGGRLERRSRLRAAGHTGEDGNGSQTSSGKKEKRKKKGSFEGELTVVESVCSCLVQRGSATRVTVLVNRGLIKEI